MGRLMQSDFSRLVRRSIGISVVAAGLSLAAIAGPAWAARDPAYAAARSDGDVAEKPDGYLLAIGGGGTIQKLVDDINIKRRAAYTDEARSQSATIEQVAFVGGCRAILRTVAGEKYVTPSGNVMTRTSAPPERDPRCL